MIVRPRLTNLVLFLSVAVQPSRSLPTASPTATTTATPTAPAAPTSASPTPVSATATPPLSMTAPISPTGTPLVTTTTAGSSTATPTPIMSATPPLSTAIITPTDALPSSTAAPTTLGIGTSASSTATPLMATLAASTTSASFPTPDTSSGGVSPTTTPVSTTQAISNYGNTPLQFEPNEGQTDRRVGYLSHGPGYTLFLTSAGATLAFVQRPPKAPHRPGRPVPGSSRSMHADLLGSSADSITATTPETESVIRLGFAGAALNAHPTLTGEDPLPGRVNYFQGKQSDGGWHTNIPTYARVTYHDVYPGIDVVYYGTQGHTLEYDWRVAPGADPTAIRMDIEGVQSTTVDGQGSLVLHTVLGDIQQRAPVVYQDIDGQRVDIPTHYAVTGAHQISFAVGAHDARRPLVIDPVLAYSTFLGGNGNDGGYGIAVDSAGDAYVTGQTNSTNFLTTPGTFSTTYGGGTNEEAFVTKLNPSGSALLYSTYLGGSSSGSDSYGIGITVDRAGDAYVTGRTGSPNFPTTPGAFSTTCNYYDAFVTKLNPSGSALLYSTFLGGSNNDSGRAIAVDGAGDAYVTGFTPSTNFPTTPGAFSTTYGGGTFDAFVTKLNPSGSALLYSTYLGGSSDDEGYGIAVDGTGDAYVAGLTASTNFPTTPGAFSTTYGGGAHDAFVTKLNPSGSALLYSTYLGGSSDDYGTGIAVDGAGDAYATGYTASTNFPTTPGAFSTTCGSYNDAYVTKLNPSGSALLYSTCLGGSNSNSDGYGIAVDGVGDAYVTGEVYASPNFPTTTGAVSTTFSGGYTDAFMATFNPSGSALLYSTYLGGSGNDGGYGIAVDGAGNAYVTGSTGSPNFPTTLGTVSTIYGGGYSNAFVAKFGGFLSTPAGSPTPTPTPAGSPTPIPNNTPTPTNTPLGSGVVPWHPHYTVPLGDRMAARVDLSDGHVDVSVDAMHLAGRSPGLAVAQTWDSGLAGGPTPLDTGAGPGWVSTLTPRIGGVLTRTVTITDETGAAWPLTYTGALSATGPYTAYSPPPGLPWQLTAALSATGATPAYTLTDFLGGSALTFDARGRLLARLDSYGNSSALTYGGGTVPLTLTNSGRSIVMGYTGTRPSDVQSPLWRASGGAQGQHVAYGYNGYGQLSSVTWGAGTAAPQTATFAYRGNYLTSIATPLGNTWAITYANGNYPEVSDIASPPGRTPQGVAIPAYDTNFSYQTVGTTPLSNLTFVTTGYGSTRPVTTMYSMDGQGNLTTVTDALLNNTTNLTYDADHDVTSSTDALGHRTTDAYRYVGPPGTSLTTTGLLTQTVRPPVQTYLAVGSSLTPLTTTYAYDPTSDDLIETDLPAGGRTLYGYDGHHSVSSVIQELGGGAGSGGCASPNTVRTASPNAMRTASATRVRAAVTVRLAGCGTPQAIWRGSMTTYNAYGERVSAVDPRGVTVLPTSGGITPTATLSASAPSYTRSYAYSPQGDLTAASSPPISTTLGPNSPVTTLYAPDADGHVATVTSPNGAATRLGYDPLGRTVAITQPAVRIFDGSAASPAAQIIYDGDGNVAQTVDPAGGVNTRAYDPLGRPVYVANPVGDTTLLTYTASALVAAQDPAGNVTGYAYDPAGRPTGATDGTGVTTSAALDAMGNTTALTTPQTYAGPSPATVDRRGYDALNRLILDTVQGSGGAAPTQTRTTATGYGPDGTVAQVQDPNGNLVVSGYDLADRFAGNTIYPAGSTTPLAGQNLTLDGANNLVEELDFTERDHARTFDGANRLLTRADCWAACPSANAVSTALSYDGNGNVVALTRQDGAGATAHSALTYNAADWLTAQSDLLDGSDQTLYGYDAAGRLRTQSLLGRTGVVTATLDAAGRATRIDENVSSGALAPPAPVGATCPTGWTCADIGSPALAGGQSLSGGTWTVQGSGDLYGSSDAFHFAWQPMLGDGSVSARVVTQTTGASPYAKAGVMLRQDTSAGSAFYDAYVAPSGFVDVLYRPTAGAATVDLGGLGGGAPVYLKVARVGGSYTAYTSSDGLAWAAVSNSTVSIAMTGTALGGLAVAANSTSALSTAQFDAVTLVTQTATTLGNAQVGASQDSYDSYNMDGSKVTTGPRGARITSMTAYVGAIDPTAANDLFQTAIYSDSNGSPGALVAASASGRLTANSWNSVALSATLAPSTTYWLVYNANGSASQYDNLAYDNGPAGSGVYATNANQAYGVWPATFGAATSITDRYSLYATSSGGATSSGVGATLGYTQTSGSADTYDSYNMDGSKVTTGPQGGQVVSLSAYVGAIDPTAANDLFQAAIYADSNGSPPAWRGCYDRSNSAGITVERD